MDGDFMKPQHINGDPIKHHLDCDGMYAKEFHLVEGGEITQHAHKIDHFSVLLYGDALITDGEIAREFTGPALLTIKAHARHSVKALTAIGWLCMWANPDNDVDPNVIDAKTSEEI